MALINACIAMAENFLDEGKYLMYGCDSQNHGMTYATYSEDVEVQSLNSYAPTLIFNVKGKNGHISGRATSNMYWGLIGIKNGAVTELHFDSTDSSTLASTSIADYDYVIVVAGKNSVQTIKITISST